MNGKHILKSAVVAALSLVVIFSVSAGSVPAQATSLDDLKQTQTDLEQKGQDLDNQLQKLKGDKAKQQQYKDALDAKCVNLEQQIDSKDLQIKHLDADILVKQKSIAEKQKNIDADFKRLKERVYALYLTGEASNLEVILNAKNIMDLADKTEILQVVSEHDTKLIDDLKADMNSIKEQKAAIEKSRATVSDAKTTLESDEKQLIQLSKESAKIIDSLGKSQQSIEAAREKNRNAQKGAEASVNQWLSNYYASKHPSNGPAPSGNTSNIISEAENYLGYPYVWGGSNPQTSFDCSGYVSWVINHSGWNVGRLGVDGLYSICTPVSGSAARPGDLVFYNYTYGGFPRSHVGIYVGGGRAIQCDDPGVEIVNLSSSYWQNHFDSFGRLP